MMFVASGVAESFGLFKREFVRRSGSRRVLWIAVWAIFFGYSISIGRRTAQLREEIDRLKQQIREG